MNDEQTGAFFGGLVLGCHLACIIAFVLIGVIRDKTDYRKQAIERGYAEYNKTTGKWQWVEKAEKVNVPTN